MAVLQVEYLPMSLARHRPDAIALLIYESSPELFDLIYGRRAIALVAQFVERSHNRFSHRYVWVAEANQEIVGMAALVPVENLRDDGDRQQVLNPLERLRFELCRTLILNRILRQDYPPQSLYIGNLAVRADYRGQGIGTQLIQICSAEARQQGAIALFISVSIDNPRAQKLYESQGFRVVGEKTIGFLGHAVGSRILSRAIEFGAR